MPKKKYIIPLFIPHLGCPHDCIFCNQKKIATDHCEINGTMVAEILRQHLGQLPPDEYHREVAYYGGSFTGLPWERQKELLSPAYEAKKANLIDGIRLSTRPDYITKEILTGLKTLGVTTIELGVQSTNQRVLHLSHRGHSKEDVDQAVEQIKSHGFLLGLQMMVGLPGDSPAAIEGTVRDFITYGPDFVRVYPTLVIRDTGLEDLYCSGSYQPLSLEECIALCKYILLTFQGADIPVIRLGLQTTEEITYGKAVVAGPFHPALREMVETEIYRTRILEAIEALPKRVGNELTIYCHRREASRVAGYRQANKKYLIERYSLSKLSIVPREDAAPGKILAAWHTRVM